MIALLIIVTSHPALSLNCYADNIKNINPSNSTFFTGYVECLKKYSTNQCKACLPNCITFNSNDLVISNDELASNIDYIYVKTLIQVSIIECQI